MERLFVYGSLRKDAPGGDIRTAKYGLEYMSKALHGGIMYDFIAWPGATFDAVDNFVHGEIVLVSYENLLRLDRYEGTDKGLFQRVRLKLLVAWAYCVTKETLETYVPPVIPSGDWLKR